MTVAELGARMSAGEFAEWQAFAEDEPFGALREDERAGVIAAMVANPNRPKGRKAFVPADFFASLREPTPVVSMRQKVRAVLFAAAPAKARAKKPAPTRRRRT